MKTKIKMIALILMAMYCVAPNISQTVNAATSTKTIAVHPSIWAIHGTYDKDGDATKVYAKNYSGYGEYGYCYGQVRAQLNGQWTEVSAKTRINKDNGLKTILLTRTISDGTRISLRLIGADTQSSDDDNKISFTY